MVCSGRYSLNCSIPFARKAILFYKLTIFEVAKCVGGKTAPVAKCVEFADEVWACRSLRLGPSLVDSSIG